MDTSNVLHWLKVASKAMTALTSAAEFYLDPNTPDDKDQCINDFTRALLETGFVDKDTAASIAHYSTEVIELVAGGKTAAADVLEDIKAVVTKHGGTLPPVVENMLSGLLVQAEAAIQAYRLGK